MKILKLIILKNYFKTVIAQSENGSIVYIIVCKCKCIYIFNAETVCKRKPMRDCGNRKQLSEIIEKKIA